MLEHTKIGDLITKITNWLSDFYSLGTFLLVRLVDDIVADHLTQYRQYRERQLQQLNKKQLRHLKAIIPVNENLLSDDTRILI